MFVGPFMLVFALVFLAPIAYALYLSVFRTQMVGGTTFVGLENYAQALADPQFWEGLGRVSLFLVVQVPIMLGIALLVALAIDSGRLYGKSFFRISIFMPYAVPAVVAALMWGFMYGTRFGLVGNINEAFGVSLPNPLSPDLVLASIGNIVTWEFVGYNMLIFYSALRVVPFSMTTASSNAGTTTVTRGGSGNCGPQPAGPGSSRRRRASKTRAAGTNARRTTPTTSSDRPSTRTSAARTDVMPGPATRRGRRPGAREPRPRPRRTGR